MIGVGVWLGSIRNKPPQTTPPPTSYFLLLNGTNNTVETPLLTFDEIELDCEVTSRGSFTKYFGNGNNGFLQRNGSNQDNWGSDFTGAFVDGIAATNNTSFIPMNTRIKIKTITGGVQRSTNMFLFSNNKAGSGATGGKMYGAVFKSGGNIVAKYDFTLGHTKDISGNGKNATLTSGSWIET